MNPAHLRTFLAVRRHRSYTRAAEDVFLSQSAVTRHVQRLEAELGVSLFEQIGRTLHVTEAGAALAGEAEMLLGRLERIEETVAPYRSAAGGSLRIGAGTTPGFYLLPAVFGRFHQEYPEVGLDYVVQDSRSVEQSVLRNDVDLGFIGGAPASGDLIAEPVAEDEIICFASPSHELTNRKRTSVQILTKHICIARKPGSATRDLFESWLAEHGGAIGRTIELGCPEAVRSLVVGGLGFSYMSEWAVADELRRKKLKRLAVEGLQLQRTIYVIRHKDKHDTPCMQAFRKMVHDHLGAPARHR